MSINGRAIDYRLRNGRHSPEPKEDSVAKGATGRIRELLSDAPGSAHAPKNGHTAPNHTDQIMPSRQLMGDSQPITVLVADDHPVVREGLIALINRQPNMRVIAEAENGCEALEKYRTARPDVALIDLRMPLMDGVQAVEAINAEEPTARLVIVTTYESEEEIYRTLRAGAQGYVLKNAPVDELIRCVRAVSEGGTWIPPEVGAKLAKRVTDRDLTMREMDVLRTVVLGKSNKEIGVVFNISEGTVKVHMTHIFEKLKVTGRTEAINVAVKRGLVRIDGTVAA